ncbi:MAG: hypothetical protein BIFFINMI_02095 [Phycisphaerae bacterium]|nr:hypothetical protein [Phycisphaerae bacterium]
MITIEFDHRPDEHQRARRLYYRKKSWFAHGDKVVASFLLVGGVGLVSVIGLRWWTVIWFGLAPLEWFNVLSLEPLVVRYKFKRSAKFRDRSTLSFSEECIHYKTPSIDSTLDWSLFVGFIEDDELFLLLYALPRAYAVIPKRAFRSDEARVEFRELVGKKVTQASP